MSQIITAKKEIKNRSARSLHIAEDLQFESNVPVILSADLCQIETPNFLHIDFSFAARSLVAATFVCFICPAIFRIVAPFLTVVALNFLHVHLSSSFSGLIRPTISGVMTPLLTFMALYVSHVQI